jgi:hypothetical protein
MTEEAAKDKEKIEPRKSIEAIEAALRELDIPPQTVEGIPYSLLIHGIARQILVEGGFGPDLRLPSLTPASAQVTRMEIEKARKLATELLAALNNLHKPAVDALNLRHRPFKLLPVLLRGFIMSTQEAVIPDLPEKTVRGQPKKERAKTITRLVATHYWCLTGRVPARTNDPITGQSSGQFHKLLGEVFRILNVEASAAAQTRAVREWKGAPWPVENSRPKTRTKLPLNEN